MSAALSPEILASPRLHAYARRMLPTLEPVPATDCLRWTRYRNVVNGYGQTRLPAPDGRVVQAHRALFMLIRGPIPEGETLDHTCRNTWCVNPYHLEAMSNSENVAKGNRDRWVEPWDEELCPPLI